MRNLIHYCHLTGKAGFQEQKNIESVITGISRNPDLPEQPEMQKYVQPKCEVTAKDLIYVNSFAELVDVAL